MSVQFPACPPSLKAIQHYLKTAAEHDGRDPVISYWCKYFYIRMGVLEVGAAWVSYLRYKINR